MKLPGTQEGDFCQRVKGTLPAPYSGGIEPISKDMAVCRGRMAREGSLIFCNTCGAAA